MADSDEERPTIVQDVYSDDMPEEHVPLYCLTKLNDAEKKALETAITSEDDEELCYVLPNLLPWHYDHDGDLKDMYRIWTEEAECRSHFAFFIDREGVANTSIIIAQPDDATMLYSDEASEWARTNLRSYRNRQAAMDNTEPENVPTGTYEGWLGNLSNNIIGKRGLTYGRVPTSALRNVFVTLDTANGDLNDCVGMYGDTVQIVENPDFDLEGCMEKLDRVIREYVEGGGEMK